MDDRQRGADRVDPMSGNVAGNEPQSGDDLGGVLVGCVGGGGRVQFPARRGNADGGNGLQGLQIWRRHVGGLYGPETLAVGFLAATVAAARGRRRVVRYLRRHGLEVFGYYRIALAIVRRGAVVDGTIDAVMVSDASEKRPDASAKRR